MIQYIERHIRQNPAYIKNEKKADSRYTKFQKEGPKGAVLHSIGTPQPNGNRVAESFNDPNAQASVHMVLQADGVCYKLAPENFRLWHTASGKKGSANDTHLGIEMTEPDSIKYDEKNGYKVIVIDYHKAYAHVAAVYKYAVELFADICIRYGWDPLKDGVILSHKECYERGIGSNHGDPEHLWKALNTGFSMDGFRLDVSKKVTEIMEDDLTRKVEFILKNLLSDIEKEKQDNDCSQWSAEAREWAIKSGVIQGIGPGTDGKPNYAWKAPITREQMIVLLYRIMVLGEGGIVRI